MDNKIKKINGRVYVIRSPSTDKIYIGSTIEPLCKRMGKHRYNFNCFIGSGDDSRWCQSFYILDKLDAYIELLSEHQNISKEELRRLEGEAIRANKDICVNKQIAGRTKKEWEEQNKDKIKENQKEYKKQNKEKIDEYQKQYQKEYKEQNKEKLREYHKKYYEKNKKIKI